MRIVRLLRWLKRGRGFLNGRSTLGHMEVGLGRTFFRLCRKFYERGRSIIEFYRNCSVVFDLGS